jgi:hypothetical protein
MINYVKVYEVAQSVIIGSKRPIGILVVYYVYGIMISFCFKVILKGMVFLECS